MILINLLPHREAARKQRREIFYVSLGAAALAGGLIAGVIFLAFQSAIVIQQGRNALLKTEITRLEGQIKDIANLQTEIAALRARQQAVEDLQGDRNMPVNLLNELAKQLPDGVYITGMKQDNQSVAISGVAQSNERVSELLRNLANTSDWLSRPELVEIVAANQAVGAKDQRRVSNFTMRVQLKRAADPAKTGTATVAPITAAKPAAAAAVPAPAAPPSAAPRPAAPGAPAAPPAPVAPPPAAGPRPASGLPPPPPPTGSSAPGARPAVPN